MGNTIKPGDPNYGKKISHKTQKPQAQQNTGFNFVVDAKTSETAYKNNLRNFFEYKFHAEKPTADGYKTIDGKVSSVENFRGIIESHKQDEQENFKKIDAELKGINTKLNALNDKLRSTLGEARQKSSVTNSPNSGLSGKADINYEIDIIQQQIGDLEKMKEAILNDRKESLRKISVYNGGIAECNLIVSELLSYGDAAQKERR